RLAERAIGRKSYPEPSVHLGLSSRQTGQSPEDSRQGITKLFTGEQEARVKHATGPAAGGASRPAASDAGQAGRRCGGPGKPPERKESSQCRVEGNIVSSRCWSHWRCSRPHRPWPAGPSWSSWRPRTSTPTSIRGTIIDRKST